MPGIQWPFSNLKILNLVFSPTEETCAATQANAPRPKVQRTQNKHILKMRILGVSHVLPHPGHRFRPCWAGNACRVSTPEAGDPGPQPPGARSSPAPPFARSHPAPRTLSLSPRRGLRQQKPRGPFTAQQTTTQCLPLGREGARQARTKGAPRAPAATPSAWSFSLPGSFP